MFNTTRTALILALLAAPLGLSAQTATEETPAATTETTTDAVEATETPVEPAPEALSLGEEAMPEAYIKSESGDWKVQCLRDPARPRVKITPTSLASCSKSSKT